MEEKQTNWTETSLPMGSDQLLGFWVRSCETVVIRNFLIEDNQCFVIDFSGDWILAPFPDYWKYFYDEPDWMEDD